ncbi:PEP-CTERM sorting domain-containing protein [Aliiglaciecola sp. 3_MG-2023]|uniref:PEP-CTERM sorting domain-containing protein n=1 Tax=Aliiglaciecola sp. 3_MG-2023 TaxID=3062644 RepID=UPI0026E1F4D4|nr:PEP-CTERM sorting domain-containing protein [Aliiglaciecola sp. 3_MG-2023]MDO6691993.1 PEP-CTERM sorting domain-containing protein [Aliiglaciecola sp. 3_MG-2023]
MKTLKLALVGILLTVGGFANAGLIYQTGSYTYYQDDSGLEWVYASPCAGIGGCGSDVTLIDDFRFATEIEWTTSFASTAELVTAFQLDNYNSNVCAASYFGSGYSHCDANDVSRGYVWGAPSNIATFSTSTIAETFLVRNELASNDIPEPTTLATLALGLLALRFRKKA